MTSRPITIGVTGGTGTGKTTIVEEILKRVSAERIAYFQDNQRVFFTS